MAAMLILSAKVPRMGLQSKAGVAQGHIQNARDILDRLKLDRLKLDSTL